jgi:hypothetical protein
VQSMSTALCHTVRACVALAHNVLAMKNMYRPQPGDTMTKTYHSPIRIVHKQTSDVGKG